MIKKTLAILLIGALLGSSPTVLPTRAAAHDAAAMMVVHVKLLPQAFSGVTGTATLSFDAATGMTTVNVMVKNLEPGSSHPAHIHSGICTTNGSVIAALTTIKANMTGLGTAKTVVKGNFTTKHAYINVHLGPSLSLTQYTVLACGAYGPAM